MAAPQPKQISKSLCNLIEKEMDEIKTDELIEINKLPANIQESVLNEKKEEKEKELNGDLYLIKIPTNLEKGENEKNLNIYFNSKSVSNELIKQELRVELLKKEVNKLEKEKRENNNNFKRDPKMIDILHKYNEIKDHASNLLGELSKHRQGAMIRDLYAEFGLELADSQ